VSLDRAGAEPRRRKFIAALIANGGDRTKAAIAAGYSPRSADTIGARLAKHPDVLAALQAEQDRLAAKLELKAEDVLSEIAAIVHFDVRKLFDADGSLKRARDLDDNTARAISSIKVRQNERGETITEIKAADKNTAIGNAMRHLGLFERDHEQAADAASALIAHVQAHNQALQVAATCKPLSPIPLPGMTSGGDSPTSTG
jgi:phage terminase small subunit